MTSIWLASEDRSEVAGAADRIDARLQRDAHIQGESRQGITRIDFEGPLGIDFEVSIEDRLVRILAVWRVPSRPKP